MKLRPSTSSIRAPSARATTSRGVETPRATNLLALGGHACGAGLLLQGHRGDCLPRPAAGQWPGGRAIPPALVQDVELHAPRPCRFGRAAVRSWPVRPMLTVHDIAALPELSLSVAAGADGLGNEVRWLHVSELADPTPVARGRRVADHDGARGRRLCADAARVRAPARRPRPRGPGVRHGLRLPGRAACAGRRGGPARLPGADRALRGAVHRAHEGRRDAPRERGARARHAGARRPRAAGARPCSRAAACRRSSPCSARASTARSRSSTRRAASSGSGTARAGSRSTARSSCPSSPARTSRRCARRRRTAASPRRTGSCSTTGRPPWRSSSPAAAPSLPPSCAWPATCSRTSSTTGWTTASSAGAWRRSGWSPAGGTPRSSP